MDKSVFEDTGKTLSMQGFLGAKSKLYDASQAAHGL
jgi:hypothetical protein